jgi:AAA+ ATPase superfamily predicted ATPase
MFIGRTKEVAALRRTLSRAPALVIVYGRRRVGKSTLLRQAVDHIPAVYFQATRLTDMDNQATFKNQVARQIDLGPTFQGLTGWEYLLSAVRDAAVASPGLTLVLDEFPYLCEANPALPSIIQKIWDDVTHERPPFNLILCGSRIAFMSEVLAERNPLYGRQSAVLDVGPLPFRDAAQFFVNWTPEERVRGYCALGGMPYYLSLVDPTDTLADNIQRLLLAETAPLREEPQHLLEAELQNVGRYASILHAVASGASKRAEIINRIFRSPEDADSISPYLQRLLALRLLAQETSMDVRVPGKSPNVRYRLADPFLAFHYRFVTPNLTALETAPADAVYTALIAPAFDAYVSVPFEELAREYVRRYGSDILPSPAREVGKIWGRDFDIDVAGTLLDGSAVFGEAKWSIKHLGRNQIQELDHRMTLTPYMRDATRSYQLFFSRSGFSPDLADAARHDTRIKLVSLDALLTGQEP